MNRDRHHQIRVALKILAVYLIACVPLFFLASVQGRHGPIMSKLAAFFFALAMPWTETFRMLRGDFVLAPFVVMFFVLFIAGIVIVWLTERSRKITE